MPKLHRRTFLKSALTAAGAAATVTISTGRAGARVVGANERLRVAVCGVGGRGRGHLGSYKSMENVEVTWLIDADQRRLQDGTNTTSDIRKALDDKNLDAISVATPNHWHSLAVIWAAQAGKHCYVEKPASHDIYEGRVALAAAKKYGVVIQHGTQQRSDQGRAN
ncbi:MAG: Gfo/Idh/MocA family oxidoreductase, partial [Thermoguttaceae bacterium]|nr:Gfo/Idh/MocA family oxidoreductase [Thermoguttaceae bacterium]